MANPERYATIQQLREEGLSDTLVSNGKAITLLRRASELVEKITRNLFYETEGTFIFDGNNSYLLHLPLALIEVTSLTINNESSALGSSDFRAYTGRALPQDDRYNPKVELRRTQEASIFTSFKSRKFLKGYDQTIVGKFGFLEPDGSTPATINECVIAIVMMTWQTLFARFGYDSGGGGGPGPMIGPLKRERTDDHEVEWWQGNTGNTDSGMIVPQYIHGRLREFRGPPTMMVTAFRFEYGE